MTPYLEEYLDFSDPEEIRLRGQRIWLHHVLKEYLEGMTLEGLCRHFESLSKAQILACLLYYHHNQPETDRHLAELDEYFQKQRTDSAAEYGDWMAALRRRKSALDVPPADRKESA